MVRLVFCLCGVAAASSLAQPDAHVDLGCAFTQAFRKEGWTVPGRLNAKLRPRANLVINGNATDIYVTYLAPPEQPVMLLLPSCSTSQPGTLELPMRLVRIHEIWQFDAGKRVFALGIRADHLDRERGRIVELLGASRILYLDDKGDGVFRIMRDWPRLSEPPPKPEWLNKLQQR